MDEKFDPELNSEKLLQQRVTTFKKAISDMIATSKSAYISQTVKVRESGIGYIQKMKFIELLKEEML